MRDRLLEELLERQKAYYRARANEYDEWFLRKGRYDHGPERNRQWFSEVEQVRKKLEQFRPTGKVLELACGTGWWTEELIRHADHVTAVDASAETLAINRGRVGDDRVRHVQADIFAWQPDTLYDLVFFSFWLSHVPPERFAAFWDLVRAALKPDGRVFFIDSLRSETATASDQQLNDPDEVMTTRRLNDAQEFQIVKVFYDPLVLTEQLRALGWKIPVKTTEHYFLYGGGGLKLPVDRPLD